MADFICFILLLSNGYVNRFKISTEASCGVKTTVVLFYVSTFVDLAVDL
jgi:hypothetical protein